MCCGCVLICLDVSGCSLEVVGSGWMSLEVIRYVFNVIEYI